MDLLGGCGRETGEHLEKTEQLCYLGFGHKTAHRLYALLERCLKVMEKSQNSRARKSLRFLLKSLLKMLSSWSLNKKKQKMIALFQKYLFLCNTLLENFLKVGYSLSPAPPCYCQHTRLFLSSL